MKHNKSGLLSIPIYKGFKNVKKSLSEKGFNSFFKVVFYLVFILFVTIAHAQVKSLQVASPNMAPPTGNPPGAPTPVSGPSSLVQGAQATSTYTVNAGSGATSYSWGLSNNAAGSITGTSTTGTMTWNASFYGTVTINCSAGNSYGSTAATPKTVTVTAVATPLVVGSISPTNQNINYNTTPTTGITSVSTGGNGTITYQWQYLLNGTWANVSTGTGANTATYTPGPLTSTTSYQEIATSGSSSVISPTATVTVYPQVMIDGPAPLNQSIESGTTAGSIACSPIIGGTGGYTYQWQSSPDSNNNDFVNINSSTNPSATTATLVPGVVNATTYYRLQVTNNGGVSYSAPGVVTINDCYQLNTSPAKTSNYIISSVMKQAGITSTITDAQLAAMGVCEVNQTIQYLDGLGRPIETVAAKASPAGNDIVQPVAYDVYGRETTKYLPYVTPGSNNGAYRSAAIGEQGIFYHPPGSTSGSQQGNGIINTTSPYAQTNFEPSPLNRVIEQGAPGDVWQPVINSTTGHTIKTLYTSNNGTSFASDSVHGNQARLFQVTINSDNSRALYSNGTYAAGTLYITITQDENWQIGRAGTIEEYKDKDGRVILKRTYNYTAGQLQQLSTYYVYDDHGLLCYVLPPIINPDNMTMPQAQTVYDNTCYQYWYDYRNRLFRKKLPGKGWEFMVYNSLNQVTFTQDANQRNPNQGSQVWTFIQYDPHGRVAITGIWSSQGVTGSAADANMSAPGTTLFNWLQSWQNGQTQLWITRNNSTTTGYVSANPQGGPVSKNQLLRRLCFPGTARSV